MREIATEAGMATGAAYYYFDSKDAIVLAFYDQAQADMVPELEEALARTKDLKERLRALLEIKLRYFEPNRRLLGALAVHTDPEHSLSPFSARTRAIRDRDVEFFSRALEGSKVRLPADLKHHLPRILWLYQMGLILYWIHDRSSGQKRTHALVDKSLPIVARLIQVSGFPLLRSIRKSLVELVETVTEES
jgi:AcrR family transcriptional regulator